VAPGVEHAFFAPGERSGARTAIDVPIDVPVILFVGRIQPLKGPDVAIRALYELGRSDALLLIVGGAVLAVVALVAAGSVAAGAVVAGSDPPGVVLPGVVLPGVEPATVVVGAVWPVSTAPSEGNSLDHGGITWSASFGVK